MNEFLNNLINSLCKIKGYTLVEINKFTELCSPWAVAKKFEDGANVILFCNEKYNGFLDENLVKLQLCDSLGVNYVEIIKVFISSGINENPSIPYNSMAIDYNKLRIVGYSLNNEVIVNDIAYCLNFASKKNSSKRKLEYSKSTVTYTLMGINIFMYIVTAFLSGNFFDSNIKVLVFLGAKANWLIAQGEYWRLIACTFLHGGLMHLVLNMYALYILGPTVEKIYGKWKYIIIYLFSGIISSILSYTFSSAISIGASGAIFGLFGATLTFALKMKDRIGKAFINNIMSVIAVNLFIGFAIKNVDNFGHIGGLIGGIVISIALWKDYN